MKAPQVAVIGAGPAGLYAAQTLLKYGAQVALINRDIKPGGLAEYGIYHDKHKMKEGLRKQFRKIIADEQLHYFGNVTIGEEGNLSLADLRQMGFGAVLVTVGAQGTKWLGLSGEELTGVYHAKDLVYHYNELPPFSSGSYAIGKKVVIVGVGNVMVDIAHWVIRDLGVEQVTAVARRGPAEVKFTKKEMESIIANLNREALDAEMARCTDHMMAVGQDPATAQAFILSAEARGKPAITNSQFGFRFFSSPKEIVGENGNVTGLLVENTKLVEQNGRLRPTPTGTTHTIEADTVVFAIGDKVDEAFGLPTKWGAFLKAENPQYPIDDISYELAGEEGLFVAGWAREASSGLVGAARKDGTNGATAVWQYLTDHPSGQNGIDALTNALQDHAVIDKADWQTLDELEQAKAQADGFPAFKFSTNEAMFEALGK